VETWFAFFYISSSAPSPKKEKESCFHKKKREKGEKDEV
jgi:hypothetical protein